MKDKSFYLTLSSNDFNKGDILFTGERKQKVEVIETPHKKWWKTILQYMTFGLYKAPYQYKIKII